MRKIKNFEKYMVTEDGKVWSIRRKKFLKPQFRGVPAYKSVRLYGGRVAWKRVHVLVAEAYLENPLKKPLVCHKDGNKANNHFLNLYWGTHKENQNDRKIHGTSPSGEQNGRAKLNKNQVSLARSLYNSFSWNQTEIARLFSVHQATISKLLIGKTWHKYDA